MLRSGANCGCRDSTSRANQCQKPARSGGSSIEPRHDHTGWGNGAQPRLCLIFAPGTRPDLAALAALAAQAPADGFGHFTVSHQSPEQETATGGGAWAELLCNGLTFDCSGLTPGEGDELPPIGPLVGLGVPPIGEIVSLAPGPHLAGGAGLLPVLATLATLGARLAALGGVQAVTWTPAGAWAAPDIFRRAIADWQTGGPFPGLVLTALRQEPNGAMVSQGLELLTGQELRIEPDKRLAAGAMARIAVRLIHELVQSGPITGEHDFVGPDGELLLAVPVRGGAQVRILLRGPGPQP